MSLLVALLIGGSTKGVAHVERLSSLRFNIIAKKDVTGVDYIEGKAILYR